MKWLNRYRKFIVATIGAGISILALWLGSADPIVVAVINLATALGVYAVPNIPPDKGE